MANYIVNGNDLTSIADSIRSKSNISGELIWPTGFKNAIDNINVKDMCIKTTNFSDMIKVEDAAALKAIDAITKIEPIQDLHGYENPWPGGGGKNKLPLLFDDIKSANTYGTWNGNSYASEGITYTVNTDDGNNVTGITLTGTASPKTGFETSLFYLTTEHVIAEGTYILSGCPSGGGMETYVLDAAVGNMEYIDDGNGTTFSITSDTKSFTVGIAVLAGVTVSNLIFKPMIRLTSEADATFVPYSNNCPIFGWDSVAAKNEGKNLFDKQLLLSGIVIADRQYLRDTPERKHLFMPVKPNTQYTLSGIFGSGYAFAFYGVNGAFLSITENVGTSVTFTTPGNVYYIAINVASAQYEDTTQLELGPTATSYEPYHGNTVFVPLPETVYGGTVDLTTGEGVVDKAYFELNTITSWNSDEQSTDGYIRFICAIPNKANGMYLRCNALPVKQSTIFAAATSEEISGANSNNNVYVSINASRLSGDLSTSEGRNNAFKSYLTDNPIHIVYELATPITYTLSPDELELYKGVNNISSDTGKIQVKYFTEAFEPLAEEIGFVNGGDY